jgi:hypothetical protein
MKQIYGIRLVAIAFTIILSPAYLLVLMNVGLAII